MEESKGKTTMSKVLARNVKRLRMERGWSAEQLAELARVSVGYIRQIESGRKFFGSQSFKEWANLFSVDASELLRPDPSTDPVRRTILYRVPVLGSIPRDFPRLLLGGEKCVVETLSLPDATTGTYAVRVHGENMAVGRDGIRDGDYALFVCEEGQSGDIVVLVDKNENIMVRRLRHSAEGFWLHSDSSDYPSRPLRNDDWVVGKVVGCWRKVKI